MKAEARASAPAGLPPPTWTHLTPAAMKAEARASLGCGVDGARGSAAHAAMKAEARASARPRQQQTRSDVADTPQ